MRALGVASFETSTGHGSPRFFVSNQPTSVPAAAFFVADLSTEETTWND
jgi:hypothetical protein